MWVATGAGGEASGQRLGGEAPGRLRLGLDPGGAGEARGCERAFQVRMDGLWQPLTLQASLFPRALRASRHSKGLLLKHL